MKKFLALLLAAIMVCSMGIFAFAAEDEAYVETTAEAAVEAAAEEEPTVAAQAANDLTSLEKKIASKGLDTTDMITLLSSAISSIGKNLKEISVDDILNLPANIMDDVVTYIFAGLKALGVDVDALYEKLSSNKVINWFVNTFYKGTALATTTVAPEKTPVPETGSAASVAVFATLSLAAAAAFVSFKKKEA